MKKLIFASSFFVASAIAANAQVDTTTSATTRDRESIEYNQDRAGQDEKYDDKERIATTELPAMIQEQLRSGDYTSWRVEEAYRKEKEGKTFYAVELTNGSEQKWVKFDAQGNKVKEKDKHDKYKDKEKSEYKEEKDHTGSR